MTGTERKALNKYYPPDFDPRKIPKIKGPRNKQYVIRVMAPFNMTCNTCNEYIYKGKKFNARRETVEDEDYLGLFIFRFYIRCPKCLAEITFKTDLKNCDYAAEHGSSRLFEADKKLQEQLKEKERLEEEEMQNPMKQLEKRTKMSRFEMEAVERLEELREIKHREAKVDFVSALAEVTKQQRQDLERQEREDEEFVQRIFAKDGNSALKRLYSDIVDEKEEPISDDEDDDMPGTSSGSKRGLDGDPFMVERDKPPASSSTTTSSSLAPAKKPKPESAQKKVLAGVVIKKRKPDQVEKEEKKTETPVVAKPSSSGLNLLGAYSSGSEEDSN